MKVFGRIKGMRSKSPTQHKDDGANKHSKGKSASSIKEKPAQDPKGRRAWKKAMEDDDSSNSNNNLSDLSNSSDNVEELRDQVTSVDENSEDYERFERQLRVKHSKACKAMSVRVW